MVVSKFVLVLAASLTTLQDFAFVKPWWDYVLYWTLVCYVLCLGVLCVMSWCVMFYVLVCCVLCSNYWCAFPCQEFHSNLNKTFSIISSCNSNLVLEFKKLLIFFNFFCPSLDHYDIFVTKNISQLTYFDTAFIAIREHFIGLLSYGGSYKITDICPSVSLSVRPLVWCFSKKWLDSFLARW